MKLSISRITAVAASSMLLLCLNAAHAQDADDSGAVETAPSTTAQVAGTWSGTDSQDGSLQGPATLVLTQNGKSIGGTFSLTTDGSTPSGKVNGRILRDDLKLTFHATMGVNHNCTAAVLATVDPTAMPATMMGTFLVKGSKKHCKGKGTFELTEQ